MSSPNSLISVSTPLLTRSLPPLQIMPNTISKAVLMSMVPSGTERLSYALSAPSPGYSMLTSTS